VEYYYDAIKLRRADNKPLVEILKSIKQALYSGEYKDTTGLAEVQEVNADSEGNTYFRKVGAGFDAVAYAQRTFYNMHWRVVL
jgi:hypothetical protein